VQAGKRFSAGGSLELNYTLGKGLTDYIGAQVFYQDFRDNLNRKLDKSLQPFDSTISSGRRDLELPVGARRRWLNGMAGWQDALLGGWQVNTIVQMATSRPGTITSGYLNLSHFRASTGSYAGTDFNIAAQVIRGRMISGRSPPSRRPCSRRAAGSPEACLTMLSAGRAISTSTQRVQEFPLRILGEQGNAQFRAEAFNVLNHENFGRRTPQ